MGSDTLVGVAPIFKSVMYLKNLLFLIFVFVALATAGQTVNKELTFDKKIHNFGTIDENGGMVSCKFRVTNIGKKPMTIVSARGGCSCVKGVVPKRPIQPGKSDYITVTFDPEYRPGHFSKELTVMTVDKKYNRIWVKGDVKPGKHPMSDYFRYNYGHNLYLSNEVLNFGYLRPGEIKSITLGYGNDGAVPIKVSFKLKNVPEGIDISAPPETSAKPGSRNKAVFTMKLSRKFKGERSFQLLPLVNGRSLNPVIIKVTSK